MYPLIVTTPLKLFVGDSILIIGGLFAVAA